MRGGHRGPARQEALRQQMAVGRVFDAEDFVEVAHVHFMADTESLGESGVECLESIARLPEDERRVRVPTVTDPRGIDFCAYRRLRQEERMAALERPAHALCGESYVGRVLVLNTAKGGVATSWMLREMCALGMGPAALLLNRANPIMAQGAAFANLPFVDRFECDITDAIATGDRRPSRLRSGLGRGDGGGGLLG